jgi:electron transport complex protein RnfB
MGDCSAVCPVDAISVADGHAEVDEKRCIDCGRCVKVCPRGLFYFANIGSSKSYYAVGCNNTEPGPETKKVCAAGCIGCGLCTRVVPDSPFALDAKVSRLDYAKARDRDLDLAVERCPSKIIRKYSI